MKNGSRMALSAVKMREKTSGVLVSPSPRNIPLVTNQI
eukprot:CAMPEP_0195534634 /NCGR_PEP_ID=MMETSP0794_2-20130614/42769_1 /TAXON_ID=515487 /ORGANISM="Stephanopyxis turris, Strain CCMP 815" /LENGTH=37 /DNA_ID= /DNA_START= /DNA_END= /DNA_ORIENTATION=